MSPCPVCDFEAKSPGGLASHARHRHPGVDLDEARRLQGAGPQVRAVLEQLPTDAPTGLSVAALRLADAIDQSQSARDLTGLVRELRATLADIAVAADSDDRQEDDGVDELTARRRRRLADADVVDGT